MRRAKLWPGVALAGCLLGTPAMAKDEPPDDAFLEFLGGFETSDGEWVDPMSLSELEADETESEQGQARAGKDKPGAEEDDDDER